jgi:hypothetical protein
VATRPYRSQGKVFERILQIGRTLNPELDNAVGIEAFGASAMRPSDPYQSINGRELMSIVESDLRTLRRLVIGEKRMRTPQDSLKV